MKTYKNFLITTTLLFPAISFAALGGLKSLLLEFGGLISLSVKIIFALALAFFFWGMAQFILNDAGNDKTREDGKKKMIWGIIALFVMFSIYGILAAVGTLTGIPIQGSTYPIDALPFPQVQP